MKSLKRILVFALAQCGLVSLHAQQTPAPQPAPPAGNPAAPSSASPPVATPAETAAAILATNVPPRPMSAAEEKNARDLLRNVKVAAPEQTRPRKSQFDNTFEVVPRTDNRIYEVVPGHLAPKSPAVVQSPVIVVPPTVVQPAVAPAGVTQDPYELELISKARSQQAEATATAPVAPVVVAPVVTAPVTPAPVVQPAPTVTAPVATAPAVPEEDPYLAELMGKARLNQADTAAAEARRQAEAAAAPVAPVAPAAPTVAVTTPAPEPAPAPAAPAVVTTPGAPAAPVAETAPQPDPYIVELIGKARAHQAEMASREPQREPDSASAAPVVTPAADSEAARKQAEAELRQKEIARIEAEVAKAAEERRRREAAAAPAVTAPVVAAPAAPAAETVEPMSSEAEALARALLQQKTRELNGETVAAPASVTPAPANATLVPSVTPRTEPAPVKPAEQNVSPDQAATLRAQQEADARAKEEARQRAYAEAMRVKEQQARDAETERQARLARIQAELNNQKTATPAPSVTTVPVVAPVVAAPVVAAPAPATTVPPAFSSRLSPEDEAKARALLDQKLAGPGSVPPSAPAVTATTALPTEEQLKADAAARREREKAAAEAARQKIRDEQRQLEAQTTSTKAEARAKADAEKRAKAEADKLAKEEARRAAEAESRSRAEAKAREKELKKAKVAKAEPAEVEPAKPKSDAPLVRTWEVPGGKTKEQRLADLFDAYSRDLISPSEYHRARAKIVAE